MVKPFHVLEKTNEHISVMYLKNALKNVEGATLHGPTEARSTTVY